MIKRLIDILISSLALIFFLPFLAFISLSILLFLGRPIMFCQVRAGVAGNPFTIYKFRTMLDVSQSGGKKLSDFERLTPFGVFLRSSSLDEIPQLWNVLRGEMSLVGPRPLLMEYVPLYTNEQFKRLNVKPGITGWAQVNGRSALSWEDKFKLDLWYVENQSLRADIKILFLTIKTVFLREGATMKDHLITLPFNPRSHQQGSEKAKDKNN